MCTSNAIVQMAALGRAGQANKVFLVPRHAHAQYMALQRDRPDAAVALDEGVLQIGPYAKYAVAFPKNLAPHLHARQFGPNLLISICWALTFTLLSAPGTCLGAVP